MTQIELFAGIGGFGLAGHWAGIKTICQVEIDPFCQKVFRSIVEYEQSSRQNQQSVHASLSPISAT